METILQDLRHAARTLRKRPQLAVTTVLTLALGIGATTAVYSVFQGVLLTPLPYPEPQELVRVYDVQPACDTCPPSFPKYHDWRERNRVFAAMGGSAPVELAMTGSGEPVHISGATTTASLARVFGVEPLLGRWYTEEEDRPGGPKVVVLAYELWRQHFDADPSVLGRRLVLDDVPYEVIGVMPEDFTGGFARWRTQVFVPLQQELDPADRGSHFLPIFARLEQGVTLERARIEMRALGKRLAREFGHNHGIDVASLNETEIGDVRRPLGLLLGAASLLLVIGCVNVSNLLLVAGLGRQRDLAVRQTLGARPWQLARQLLSEGVLLAAAGGALGVLLAYWLVDLFLVLAGDSLPRIGAVAIDWRVVGVAVAVSAFVGVVCSLTPVVVLCRGALASTVREGDARSGSHSGKRLGNVLVVAEIALAFALLVVAGLLVKNFRLLAGREAGVRTDHVIAFDVAPSGARYTEPERIVAFYRQLEAGLAALPDVESVGITSHLPMYSNGTNGEFQIEGGAPWDPRDAPLVEYRWIYGDYLETLGVPLIAGRLLDARDGPESRAVLINRAMAEKFWPGQDPLGRRFGRGEDVSGWYRVVGVIGDIRSYGLTQDVPYEFYRTIEQSPYDQTTTVVLRSRGPDPRALIPAVRRVLAAIDPALPISQIQTMEQVVADSLGRPRLLWALTGIFGLLAGLLAAIGIYGVTAYTVGRQLREFGIRGALGASRAQVTTLVLRGGLVLGLVGVALGALGALAAGGVLQALLYDVQSTDMAVFATSGATMLAVVLLACFLPAHRAARVDPMIALRAE